MKSLNIKYFRLFIPILLVLFFSLMIFEDVIKADYHASGRKDGAKPYVRYHSSVDSYGYKDNYDAGRAYWNGNSKVNITMGSVYANPDVYYIGNTATNGLFGRIVPYDASGNVVSADSYWEYTNVTMYDNQMKAQSNYTDSRINYNAAHEVGHTIKMAHVPAPYNSVMVQGWYISPSSITSYDSGEVNSKW